MGEIQKRQEEGNLEFGKMKKVAASAIGKEMFYQMKEAKLFDGFGNIILLTFL